MQLCYQPSCAELKTKEIPFKVCRPFLRRRCSRIKILTASLPGRTVKLRSGPVRECSVRRSRGGLAPGDH